MNGRIKTNNSNAARVLLLKRAGIAALSDMTVYDDIRQGRLIRLLPDYEISSAGVYAVYPEQRFLPIKTRSFIDYLARYMRF